MANKVVAKAGALTAQNAKLQGQPVMEKMSDFLARPNVQEWMMNAIGDKKEVQKFVSSIVSATSTNMELQSCERNSVISAALLAQSLNMSLSPQLGLCYLVPFKSKAKYDKEGNLVKEESKTATFVLGYKGYLQLAIRSGLYKDIGVSEVREGELKSFNPFTGDIELEAISDEKVREQTPIIGYYAYLKLNNGFHKGIYWPFEKMLAHADKYSAAFKAESYKAMLEGKIPEKDKWKYSSYWYNDFNGMAFKTMLRQLISKWGVMSIDMQTAYENEIKAEQEQLSKSSMGIDVIEVPTGTVVADSSSEADHLAVDSETGEVIGNVPAEE